MPCTPDFQFRWGRCQQDTGSQRRKRPGIPATASLTNLCAGGAPPTPHLASFRGSPPHWPNQHHGQPLSLQPPRAGQGWQCLLLWLVTWTTPLSSPLTATQSLSGVSSPQCLDLNAGVGCFFLLDRHSVGLYDLIFQSAARY